MENEGFRVDAIKGVATFQVVSFERDVFRRNFFGISNEIPRDFKLGDSR